MPLTRSQRAATKTGTCTNYAEVDSDADFDVDADVDVDDEAVAPATKPNSPAPKPKKDIKQQAIKGPSIPSDSTALTDRWNINFPQKVYKVLQQAEEHNYTHIISWLPCGTAFKVHCRDAFIEAVLPAFGMKKKWDSFLRQLNHWGFKRLGKCVNDTREWTALERKGAYRHEHFFRGDPSRGANVPSLRGKNKKKKSNQAIKDQKRKKTQSDDERATDEKPVPSISKEEPKAGSSHKKAKAKATSKQQSAEKVEASTTTTSKKAKTKATIKKHCVVGAKATLTKVVPKAKAKATIKAKAAISQARAISKERQAHVREDEDDDESQDEAVYDHVDHDTGSDSQLADTTNKQEADSSEAIDWATMKKFDDAKKACVTAKKTSLLDMAVKKKHVKKATMSEASTASQSIIKKATSTKGPSTVHANTSASTSDKQSKTCSRPLSFASSSKKKSLSSKKARRTTSSARSHASELAVTKKKKTSSSVTATAPKISAPSSSSTPKTTSSSSSAAKTISASMATKKKQVASTNRTKKQAKTTKKQALSLRKKLYRPPEGGHMGDGVAVPKVFARESAVLDRQESNGTFCMEAKDSTLNDTTLLDAYKHQKKKKKKATTSTAVVQDDASTSGSASASSKKETDLARAATNISVRVSPSTSEELAAVFEDAVFSTAAAASPGMGKREAPIFMMDLMLDRRVGGEDDDDISAIVTVKPEEDASAKIMEAVDDASTVSIELTSETHDVDDAVDVMIESPRPAVVQARPRRPSTAKSHAQVVAVIEASIPDVFKSKAGKAFLSSPLPVPTTPTKKEARSPDVDAAAVLAHDPEAASSTKEVFDGKKMYPVVVTPEKDRKLPEAAKKDPVVAMPALRSTPSCSSLDCESLQELRRVESFSVLGEACCDTEPLPLNAPAGLPLKTTDGTVQEEPNEVQMSLLGLLRNHGVSKAVPAMTGAVTSCAFDDVAVDSGDLDAQYGGLEDKDWVLDDVIMGTEEVLTSDSVIKDIQKLFSSGTKAMPETAIPTPRFFPYQSSEWAITGMVPSVSAAPPACINVASV